MLQSVYLNDKSYLMAVKIRDKITYCLLTLKPDFVF